MPERLRILRSAWHKLVLNLRTAVTHHVGCARARLFVNCAARLVFVGCCHKCVGSLVPDLWPGPLRARPASHRAPHHAMRQVSE